MIRSFARSSAHRGRALVGFAIALTTGCGRGGETLERTPPSAVAIVDTAPRLDVPSATAVPSQGSAAKVFTDLRADGALSATSKTLLSAAARDADPKSIEALLEKASMNSATAWEIAKRVNVTLDDQTVVEPIVIAASGADHDPYARAIAVMPKAVEIDDGEAGARSLPWIDAPLAMVASSASAAPTSTLPLHLQRVSSLNVPSPNAPARPTAQCSAASADKLPAKLGPKESVFLVLWARPHTIFGFVYRTRHELSLGDFVVAAPKLVHLVETSATR